MGWKVEFLPAAQKDLRQLGKTDARQVLDYLSTRIEGCANPRTSGKALKHGLRGLWRYRVGKIRIICELRDDVVTVLVLKVGKRDRVY